MNYGLLKAKSTFSLEDIFLIYLKIEPSNYKQMDGTYYWLDISHSDDDWGDNDTTVTSRIYKMRSKFLKDHSDIVTEEKINAAYKLYNSLKSDAESKLLKIHSTDFGTEQVFVLREDIHQWFIKHQLTWPDELKPFNFDSELESAKNEIKDLQDKLNNNLITIEALKNKMPDKWRKAFEYESDGLNALYDLIEKYYFDDTGNPIYDPKKMEQKQLLKSGWLAGRTLQEADTIITSGNRKGAINK